MKLFLLTVTLITAVNVNCRKRTKPPDKQNSTGAKASLPDPPLTANLITSDISTGPESSLNSTQILEPQPKDFQERKYMNELAKLGRGIKADPCSSFGGKSVAQQCLSINEDSKRWEQAVTLCEAKGQRLAVLQDPVAFKAYMKKNHGGKKYWLGGSDRDDEGLWTWINGQSLGTDFPWGPGEPNDAGGKEDCLEYAYGNYNDNKCTGTMGYVCEPDPCLSIVEESVAQQCLSINEDSKTWEQARTSCKAKGRRLAVLQDPDAFKAYMKRNHGGKRYWLGGSDRGREGLWTWINGQSLGTDFPWGPGEPNDAGGKEDCLEYAYGNYNDNACTGTMGYVCEPVSGYSNIAEKYAPKLRFDQKQGKGDLCFPSSASDYHDKREAGDKGRICNRDYNSIRYGRVPTYWKATECGNHLIIAYWVFYGYQDCCFEIGWLGICEGSHDIDWEHIYVKVENYRSSGSRKLGRVQFYQHKGMYTKNAGNYDVDGTHPVVYIGKNSHGSYHDDGGSGGCCYFEDWRNPKGADKHMNTWLNLREMNNLESDPHFKKVMYSPHFDSPMERGETNNMCRLKGCRGSKVQTCHTSGCSKSDVNDDNFF